MPIISKLAAGFLLLTNASTLVIALPENELQITCPGADPIDKKLTVIPSNERESIFLSNGTWVRAKIDGTRLWIQEYDGKAGPTPFLHLGGLSEYRGSRELVFFHVRAGGESLIYWRELTNQNVFEHGLLRFDGLNLAPMCSERTQLLTRQDLGITD